MTNEINSEQGQPLWVSMLAAATGETPEDLLINSIGADIEQYRLTDETSAEEAESVADVADTRLLSIGDISTVTGAAKSRKTLFVTALCNHIITGNHTVFSNHGEPSILYIDTEQQRYHAKRTFDRIVEGTAETQRSRLHYYTLRSVVSRADKLKAVCMAIDRHRPSLVVLDGVADIMHNTNDNEESAQIVALLMGLAEGYNCHITNVLHTSSANAGKGRGHLGSEFERKSETVLLVQQDGDSPSASTVKPTQTRNKRPPTLTIAHTDTGGWVLSIQEQPRQLSDTDIMEMAKKHYSVTWCAEVSPGTEIRATATQMDAAIKAVAGNISQTRAQRIREAGVAADMVGLHVAGNKKYYTWKTPKGGQDEC